MRTLEEVYTCAFLEVTQLPKFPVVELKMKCTCLDWDGIAVANTVITNIEVCRICPHWRERISD